MASTAQPVQPSTNRYEEAPVSQDQPSCFCATIVFREGEVLIVRRRNRTDRVPPGGHPQPREGVLACDRWVREQTGLDVDLGPCVFVVETIDPSGEQRVIEVMFLYSRSTIRPASRLRGWDGAGVCLAEHARAVAVATTAEQSHPGTAQLPPCPRTVAGRPVAAGNRVREP